MHLLIRILVGLGLLGVVGSAYLLASTPYGRSLRTQITNHKPRRSDPPFDLSRTAARQLGLD